MVIDMETGEVIKTFVRSAENYDMREASKRSRLFCREGRTKQSFKDETDINTIVKRFGLGGIPPSDLNMPQDADFTELAVDFHTAMNLVREAGEEFMRVPADIRARFHNDPQELMRFVAAGENREEAIKLGLIPKPPRAAEDPPGEPGEGPPPAGDAQGTT